MTRTVPERIISGVQYQKPVLIQQQKLKLSPQMLQSIQLMALPIVDLKEKINEELESNPALELISDPSQLSFDEINSTGTKEYDLFENSSDPGYSASYDEEAAESKQKFLEGAVSQAESLAEHLLWQLRLQPISKDAFEIGERLIMNLDENGFHILPPEELLEEGDLEQGKQLMEMIQGFDPVGICSSGYREALLVQARKDPNCPPLSERIIQDYLDQLQKTSLQELSQSIKAAPRALEEAIAYIKTLTPFPGRLFSREQPHYVVPDLSVRLEEGEFRLYLNDIDLPVLGISPFYEELKSGKETDSEARSFANGHVRQAEQFIYAIEQRKQSLLKVSKAIVEFQRDFFLKGPKYLVPLTLKNIAEVVSVHETTVSRIANAKHMQTEWGIFPIKYFFTNSISGSGTDGSRYSKVGVKEIIREIIEEDTGSKRLSDQKISDLLQKRGIKIARRTVSKYRKELKIDSSFER